MKRRNYYEELNNAEQTTRKEGEKKKEKKNEIADSNQEKKQEEKQIDEKGTTAMVNTMGRWEWKRQKRDRRLYVTYAWITFAPGAVRTLVYDFP